MDDKEKEKFGVIIDKNDQNTENQPKVDESAEDKNINKESVTTSSESSTNPEEKQLESDKTSDVLEKNEEKTNLEESVKDNQQNPQNESEIKNDLEKILKFWQINKDELFSKTKDIWSKSFRPTNTNKDLVGSGFDTSN